MGHWMTDVNGDDYYVEGKGHWMTDVNGDDYYVKDKGHWMTRLYFGKHHSMEVDEPIEIILSKIEEGCTWLRLTETSTKFTITVNIKTVQCMTEYGEWI